MEAGFLAELEPSAREALESLGRRRRYDAGVPLFLEGDVAGSVMIVHSGRVKIGSTSDGGHTVILAINGPGDVLGDISAVDGAPRSASATALEPVDAQVIPSDDFRAFLHDVPGAGLALLRVMTARMRAADRRRVEFGSRDAMGRVALRLVELADTEGETTAEGTRITLPLTQDELAQWIAASREAVARALASLRKRGLVTTARREILITDLDGLRDAAR